MRFHLGLAHWLLSGKAINETRPAQYQGMFNCWTREVLAHVLIQGILVW
jgi:hypothetical protein